jgi:hypothetical protein
MEGNDILAAASPRALFGDAVDDARALKRAYASLIRRFGPDAAPDVFAHIRRLYEAARDGDSDGPKVADVIALHPTPPSVAPSPAERLEHAMQEGQADEAIALLTAHDLELRITTPNAWFAAVAALADARTFVLPAQLLQGWLDGIEHPPEGIPDELLERIELLTSTGIDYQAARNDPAIDPALLDLIARWGASPVQTAEAFMAAQQALPDPRVAREAFRALKTHYPGLWYPLTLMMNMVTHEVETFDEAASEPLSDGVPAALLGLASALGRTESGKVVDLQLYVAAFAGLLVFLLAGRAHPVIAILSGTIGFTTLLIAAIWETRIQTRASRFNAQTVFEVLLAFGAQRALFPSELLDFALPPEATSEPYNPAMLLWQRDPTTLMRVLTPAHLDRIRDRVSPS